MYWWSRSNPQHWGWVNGRGIVPFHLRIARMPISCTDSWAGPCHSASYADAWTEVSSRVRDVPRRERTRCVSWCRSWFPRCACRVSKKPAVVVARAVPWCLSAVSVPPGFVSLGTWHARAHRHAGELTLFLRPWKISLQHDIGKFTFHRIHTQTLTPIMLRLNTKGVTVGVWNAWNAILTVLHNFISTVHQDFASSELVYTTQLPVFPSLRRPTYIYIYYCLTTNLYYLTI